MGGKGREAALQLTIRGAKHGDGPISGRAPLLGLKGKSGGIVREAFKVLRTRAVRHLSNISDENTNLHSLVSNEPSKVLRKR